MSTNNEKEKKDLFRNLTSGASDVANALGKGMKKVGDYASAASSGIGNTAKKGANAVSDMADNQKKKRENKEIDVKIIEHKYNIGRLVYDSEIDIDDGVVISKINSIDRLVDEITKLEGNSNG